LTPQEKRKQTLIKRLGSEEAYIEYMRTIGRKGGKVGGMTGFALDTELARKAGRIGGLNGKGKTKPRKAKDE
jgi:general stress protein YciG